MPEHVSSYYPPRARWSSVFVRLWQRLRSRLWVGSWLETSPLSARQWLLGLLIPGCSWWILGRKTIGRRLLLAYAVSLLVFVVAIGYPAGTVGYVLMLAIHTLSLVYLFHRVLPGRTILLRLCVGLLPILAYSLVQQIVEERFFLPFQFQGQVVVVSRSTKPTEVRPGDLVAYRFENFSAPGFLLRGGLNLGAVLAAGGDEIRFGTNFFQVNGRLLSRRNGMPQSGSLTVSEKDWFIWPTGLQNHLNPIVENLHFQAAQVHHDQLVGRAFGHWFGRRQSIP
jgi:hypothetical protein